MKYCFYSISLLFLFIFISCKDDNENGLRHWSDNQESVNLVYGSSQGGKYLDFKKDSLRNVYIQKFIKDKYLPDLYQQMTVDFNGEWMTYIDSLKLKKYFLPYLFENDSLFGVKSDGSRVFVAEGNKQELSRYRSAIRVRLPAPRKDTIYVFDYPLTEAKALQIANVPNLASMTSPNDTVMWVNIQYRFRK